MKQPYIPPRLDVVIFAPVERLMASDLYDDLESLDEQFNVFDLKKLTDLSGSAGSPTVSNDGDIFLPFW